MLARFGLGFAASLKASKPSAAAPLESMWVFFSFWRNLVSVVFPVFVCVCPQPPVSCPRSFFQFFFPCLTLFAPLCQPLSAAWLHFPLDSRPPIRLAACSLEGAAPLRTNRSPIYQRHLETLTRRKLLSTGQPVSHLLSFSRRHTHTLSLSLSLH